MRGTRRHLRAVEFIARTPVTSGRVAAWTCLALVRIGRDLDRVGLNATARLARAPEATSDHRRILVVMLRLARASCLVRSAVLQRWDADHGHPRDLVIGVRSSGDAGFVAHAWLEGDRDGGYVELHRQAPS